MAPQKIFTQTEFQNMAKEERVIALGDKMVSIATLTHFHPGTITKEQFYKFPLREISRYIYGGYTLPSLPELREHTGDLKEV